MRTVRRDWLRRQIEAGKFLGRWDTRFDAMTDGTESNPDKTFHEVGIRKFREEVIWNGTVWINDTHFSGYGGAYMNPDGTVTLHSGSSSWTLTPIK